MKLDVLNRPTDPASLVFFRFSFGICLFVAMLRYFAHDWIQQQFYQPSLFFPWQGFEWVKPWPWPWMYVHFSVLALAALGIAFGFFYRASCAVFCLDFSYVHLIDKTNYLNHYYLISLLTGLLFFLPLGRVASLDVKWRRVLALDAIPFWAVALLRFQVAIVYFYSGIAKLESDWLLRAQPLRIWLAQHEATPGIGSLLAHPATAYFFSWAGALFDLTIPFFLLWKRTRIAAFVALVFFHVATAVLFPIGMFPWIMMLCALVFLPASWPKALITFTKGEPERTTNPQPLSRFHLTVLGLYAAIQLLVPLRCWLYPGDLLWTEQGFRFSWRVMLIEKKADTRFFSVDAKTGEEKELPISHLLTPVQRWQMSTQPDMIEQMAQYLKEREASHGRNVTIRAMAWIVLNGQPARALILEKGD